MLIVLSSALFAPHRAAECRLDRRHSWPIIPRTSTEAGSRSFESAAGRIASRQTATARRQLPALVISVSPVGCESTFSLASPRRPGLPNLLVCTVACDAENTRSNAESPEDSIPYRLSIYFRYVHGGATRLGGGTA